MCSRIPFVFADGIDEAGAQDEAPANLNRMAEITMPMGIQSVRSAMLRCRQHSRLRIAVEGKVMMWALMTYLLCLFSA
jgi:hypothetical protein